MRRVCTKHIDKAMERLEQKKGQQATGELSVVERILAEQPDRKLAYVLALDLILVGIDTVGLPSRAFRCDGISSLKKTAVRGAGRRWTPSLCSPADRAA